MDKAAIDCEEKLIEATMGGDAKWDEIDKMDEKMDEAGVWGGDLVVVWDLDGTLIRDNEEGDFSVVMRPGVEAALSLCFATCKHVGVWTAASRWWFDLVHRTALKSILDRIGYSFSFVWCGDRCTRISRPYADDGFSNSFSPSMPIKPLGKFWKCRRWGATRHNTVVVDDTPRTFVNNWGNAMAVPTFSGDQEDGGMREWCSRFKSLLKRYRTRNWHAFSRLGFSASIISIIHSYSPTTSVRGLQK